MLIGVTTCPDKANGGKRIGYCATMNRQLTKFHSNSWVQKSAQSLIENMGVIIEESIMQYHAKNK